ncbi:MAG TPA: GNAT family N-acyltransferase [Pyrinomonadaceae bacterium]|nr:GNAT family N-acyltransferase [Pyrinomonadaceae bacterium]
MNSTLRSTNTASQSADAALLVSVPPADSVGYPVRPDLLPDFEAEAGRYVVRLVRTPGELDAVLRLRFEVFNLELAEGLDTSFLTGRDEDEFDATSHHLLVLERSSGQAVGTYRLRTSEADVEARGFYSAGEFNLACLPPQVAGDSVEIGRACVAREHRNTQVLFLLWRGLAAYLRHSRKRYFFGCCSLAGADAREGLRVLSFLERGGHMHPAFYVPPRAGFGCDTDGDPIRYDGEPELPRLFRSYLRFGAKVCGPPALDRAFKTTDFFVIFDADRMDARTRRLFFEG